MVPHDRNKSLVNLLKVGFHSLYIAYCHWKPNLLGGVETETRNENGIAQDLTRKAAGWTRALCRKWHANSRLKASVAQHSVLQNGLLRNATKGVMDEWFRSERAGQGPVVRGVGQGPEVRWAGQGPVVSRPDQDPN